MKLRLLPAELHAGVEAVLSGERPASTASFLARPDGGCTTAEELPRGAVCILPAERSFTWRTAAEEEDWAACERVGETSSGDSLWAVSPLQLLHEEGGVPAVVLLPLPPSEKQPHGAFAVVALRHLAAGELVSYDAGASLRRGSASRAASLVHLLNGEAWAQPAERTRLLAAVSSLPPPARPAPRLLAAPDAAPLPPPPPLPLRLFTDYALLHELLSGDPRFSLQERPEDADALWQLRPIGDYRTLPPTMLVNQFPFEGCLVRKDLLPLTAQLAEGAAASPFGFPPWSPPAYDLSTQAHAWLAHHRAQAAPLWIVKRAADSHSRDCSLLSSEAAVLRHGLASDCDRIAQLYVARPRLLRGRKFDLRVYVSVRSFWPLEARADVGRLYARLAAAPYSTSPADLVNYDSQFTVNWYGGGGAGEAPALMNRGQLAAAAAEEGWEWEGAEARMLRALRALFESAGRHFVGPWPRSRGLYGVDVMFDEEGQPLVLEVNFAGDLSTLRTRVPGGDAEGCAREAVAFLMLGEAGSLVAL